MTQTWDTHRAQVISQHGLVAAQNARAAQAGASVLAQGGNAMDAAVVTALVLSVVEPWLSGVGGGGFLLHADGASGVTSALDFNVKAGSALSQADYPPAGAASGNWFNWPSVQDDRNAIGYSSICVPGAIAGLSTALARFGTLRWEDALAPAIAHAEQGLGIDWFAALCISIEAATLARFDATAALFLENGLAPRVADGAERFKSMPAKARMLRRLAQAGARDFYEGETAQAIATDLAAGGATILAADLAAYQPRWVEPLTQPYRDWTLHAIPGLSGGPSFMQAMAQLAESPMDAAGSGASALRHADAARQACETRLTTLGHAARDPGCTSHVSVIDRWGNLVSLTNTLLSRFGSRVVLPQSGMLMNNGMMWFDPRPGQPNSIAAGAQPLANMCPLILSREGAPAMAIGAAGGRAIVPALLQLVSSVVDHGMSLEQAFHVPRLDASAPVIKINALSAPDVAAAVAQRHPIDIVEDTLYPVQFAIPSAVLRDAAGARNIGMAHPNSPWAFVAEGG
jgi:gamma-glutamyltranspeptidase/glutathione hydrolase